MKLEHEKEFRETLLYQPVVHEDRKHVRIICIILKHQMDLDYECPLTVAEPEF